LECPSSFTITGKNPGEGFAGLVFEAVEDLRQPPVDGVVVEGSRHVADVGAQRLEHVRVGLAS
jgi:hypothetical protein